GVLPATFSTSPGGGSAHWSFYANFNSPYIVGSLVGSPTIAVFQTYSAIQVSATASIGSSIPSVSLTSRATATFAIGSLTPLVSLTIAPASATAAIGSLTPFVSLTLA